MRKVLCAVAGLMLFAVTFVACFDEKDFKFDRLTLNGLEPTVYLPLVNDTVRLDANNDYNVLYDEDGVGYLRFDIDSDNILPAVDVFFDVPDAEVKISGASFDFIPEGLPSVPVEIPSQTYKVTYDFSDDDQQIDSITFKAGTLTFNLDATGFTGSSSVTIPELKKNGVAFSASIPFGTPVAESLSGYTLTFNNNNKFDVEIGPMTVQSEAATSGTHQLNADITFKSIMMKEVHGYFGQQSSFSSVTVDVSAFDKFRNETDPILKIREAWLYFSVNNGAGFPIGLKIGEVTSTASTGASSIMSAGSVTILANPSPQNSWLRSDLRIGGEALGTVLSNMPSSVAFDFSASINPDGNTGEKNFLTDESAITLSNVEARIPLDFSVRDMVLEDTLDFNSSKVTFNDMELLLNVENSMPVSVTLQAYLMDEQGILLRDKEGNLQALFKDRVSIPAATVDDATGRVTEPFLYHPKENIEANVKMLEQTKKIKVAITVATNPASEFVQITKDNYVYLRMGAKAKVNIDNLD